ncbi:MAG: tetratricopeptide repeat protein [Deltaproteobacteria bacterium]|jgi:tetratricopeptide (TPR) repeat protein|nr:tetratricopeptide repeat protein [Deltaproteobacteria bacterium]
MADKMTRMDLEEPDKLQVLFEESLEYVQRNRTRITIIATVVVIVVLLVAGWFLYSRICENKALALYQPAFLLEKSGDAKKVTTAVKQYRDLLDAYPRSNAAVLASYRLGNLSFKMNRYDEAIVFYNRYLGRASKSSDLTTLVLSALGASHEAKKDLKKALEYYEKAIVTPVDNGFVALNYQNIARIYEEMNDKAKALDYYEKALAITVDPATELFIKRKIALNS